MNALDVALVFLRVLVYAGSVAAAGGILYAVSFPRAAGKTREAIKRQIVVGVGLLLFIEPIRYVAFQLALAGADWTLAFSPGMRWIGMQTGMGQAAAVRWIAALALLAAGSWPGVIQSLAAVAMIGSFALEGHTASAEWRSALGTTTLVLHLAAIHWWLGSLYSLFALTRRSDPEPLVSTVETFSNRAVWIVATLVAAGAVLLGHLTDWTLRIDSAYQLRFLLKLGLVTLLLSIASWNRFRLTPLLRRDHAAGAAAFAASIKVEIAAALSILVATAWAISTAPDE